MLNRLQNESTTSGPKIYETPRSLSPHPTICSGSAHNKSHSKPVSGTPVGLANFLIWSNDFNSGLSPPCIQNILSATMAATGRQLKQSVNRFQSLGVYRRLHSS